MDTSRTVANKVNIDIDFHCYILLQSYHYAHCNAFFESSTSLCVEAVLYITRPSGPAVNYVFLQIPKVTNHSVENTTIHF